MKNSLGDLVRLFAVSSAGILGSCNSSEVCKIKDYRNIKVESTSVGKYDIIEISEFDGSNFTSSRRKGNDFNSIKGYDSKKLNHLYEETLENGCFCKDYNLGNCD